MTLPAFPQWSPAFGAGKSGPAHDGWRNRLKARNGAQLLELGKAHPGNQLDPCDRRSAMEPSFWSWEKPDERPQGPHVLEPAMEPSSWSWEK